LTISGIAFENVLTFSRNKPAEYDAQAIRNILSEWDSADAVPEFSRGFKRLFIECRSFFEKALEYQRERLMRLNVPLTVITGADEEALEPLKLSQRDAQENAKSLTLSLNDLKDLNSEFFSELKRVCDKIGIFMPEPSEADMYDDVPDPLDLLKAYMKGKGIKSNVATGFMIRDTFRDITPKLGEAEGGAGNRETVLQILRDNCCVESGRIRINLNVADEYQSEIFGIGGKK
jgi:hypothetical protein